MTVYGGYLKLRLFKISKLYFELLIHSDLSASLSAHCVKNLTTKHTRGGTKNTTTKYYYNVYNVIQILRHPHKHILPTCI